MFVVDGVELHLGQQAGQVREFEGRHALRLQQDLEAAGKAADVGDMGEDVVRGHQVGGMVLVAQGGGGVGVEEGDAGRHALLFGQAGGVAGGFDAKDGDAHGDEVLQQVAVVRGDLDDLGLRAEVQAGGHRDRIAAGVVDPAGGPGRQVGVIVREDRVGGRRLGRLGQPAAFADHDMQRKAALGGKRRGVTGGQVAVGKWRGPEVDKRQRQGRVAEAAGGHGARS